MDEWTSRQQPLREDMAFQRRSWRIERVGWCLLAAVPLIALTGVLGNGPLSTRQVGAPPFSAEYERFQRVTRLAPLRLTLGAVQSDTRDLHLDAEFQHHYEISSVQPEPAQTTAGRNGIAFRFAATPGEPLAITIWARPRSFGALDIAVRSGDGPALTLPTFVYP